MPTDVRQSLEFHDSTVLELVREDGALRIRLEGYVHVSAGRPGLDRGAGWIKPLDLVLRQPKDEDLPSVPCAVFDGEITCGTETFKNLVPLPLSHAGAARVVLRTANGILSASAGQLSLTIQGQGRYLEEFTGLS
jgi:hypothetical protein